jgi:hypothetical protein
MGEKQSRARACDTSLLARVNRTVTEGVRSLAESVWLKFITGVVLLTSGLDEALDTLVTDLASLNLGAHHGVMMLGFVNVLSSLPDMLDGLVGTVLLDEVDDEVDEDDSEDAVEAPRMSMSSAHSASSADTAEAPPQESRRAA